MLVERSGFGPEFDRREYTMDVLRVLIQHEIDVVAMAGFMTIFSPEIFESHNKLYAGKILNTHPSLLPSFKGEHAVKDALEYGVKLTGCTIHVATAQLDAGPILGQESVLVHPRDTVSSLHERIKIAERALYPIIIAEFLAGLK